MMNSFSESGYRISEGGGHVALPLNVDGSGILTPDTSGTLTPDVLVDRPAHLLDVLCKHTSGVILLLFYYS